MRVSDLARDYAKGYVKYLIDNEITVSSKDAYNNFRDILTCLYGLDTNKGLEGYSKECYQCLKGIKDSVKDVDYNLISDIIDCSSVYTLVAIQYCSGNIGVKKRSKFVI